MDLNRDNISDATLTYKGSKKYLENFIYLLSCRWFLSYKIEKPSKLFYSLILKNNIKYKVPLFLQSLIYLIRFTINRIPLKKKNDPRWLREKNTLFIFSNFAHLDKKSGDLGKYYSKQWENLPEQLEKKGYRINWLHIFLKSSVIPNAKIGRNWIDKFNLDSEKQGYHAFLEQHLDWKIFFKVIYDWFRSNLFYHFKLKNLPEKYSEEEFDWVWPVLQKEWTDSWIGKVAMHNILLINLLDKSLGKLPKQRVGLYLQENQGWERIFLYFWRKHGHGRIIGVRHATLSFGIYAILMLLHLKLFQISLFRMFRQLMVHLLGSYY